MMSQILRSDVKLLNNLARLHRGSGISNVSPVAGESTCPNCGRVPSRAHGGVVGSTPGPAWNTFKVRLLSTQASAEALSASAKKPKKKKVKKVCKSTTEIIQENACADVTESKAKLLKFKVKDMTAYLGKLVNESTGSTKSMRTSAQSRGLMSYSTYYDHSSVLANELSPSSNEPLYSQVTSDCSATISSQFDQDLEVCLKDDGFDGAVVVSNPTFAKTFMIPQEKDLIDSEFELETEVAKSGEPLENESITPSPQVKPKAKKQKTKKGDNKVSHRLKSEERELMAKVKREEMDKLAREVSLNKSLVAYLDLCVFTRQLHRGHQTLNYYRNRSRNNPAYPSVNDVKAFDCLLHGYASKGNISKVKEIFKTIEEDGLKPSIQSYAAVFECLGRLPPIDINKETISSYIDQLTSKGYCLDDLFNDTVFTGNQREKVYTAIRRCNRGYSPNIRKPSMDYSCRLLQGLNQQSSKSSIVSPAAGLIPLERLSYFVEQQLKTELQGTVTVRSVERKEGVENLPFYRKLLQETEQKWEVAIKEAVERNLTTLVNHGIKNRSHKTIGLYPFLKVLKPDDYVHILTQEIRKLAEGSETYSPTVTQLYRELGGKVLARYQIMYKKETGIMEKVQQLYHEYTKWYLDPATSNARLDIEAKNPRQMWQQLLFNPQCIGPDVDIEEKTWPNSVLSSIGRFLYGIIMRDIKIDAQVMKLNNKVEHLVPAFYSIFRMQGVHLKEEIKPHPALVKLFQAASKDELTFDSTLVPMISPPLPWASIRTGGYLLTPAKIIRLPHQAHQQKVRLESCPQEDLYPSLDSLNQLGAVPWKINHKVLDTVVQVFNNKGDDSLGIPPPPSECPLPPSIEVNMTRQEKFKVHKTRLALKRQKAEMYSLWCDALYRLSLANHFRDDIFWFPHNMDFRGRVYPCPPHLNHLGADMARSILVFAQGKPLGSKGLDWLKIHLVNLTGLKKRDSVQTRLEYANEILDDILDSADNPLQGRKWWMKSEEPWQTLATCIEIANAIRSGDPATYISHFPVHQDGSCNGLQHYAALGRDQAGAESVNLAPSPVPQDVYSSVASLVEKLRDRDAKRGVKIAQVLEGFVKRKVIKQTVMTTVYGVTKYGARLQIAKQLKDIPDFPKEHMWPASLYLVGRTFDSLQEMFTSTKQIQDWFTECARLISQVCGQNVEWVTPIGLPVVQPYFRASKKAYEAFDPMKLPELHVFDCFERPNVMKQKNAFPPNFIHSLDSSHMMLTSLHAEREGITFVSVHDCYWTHPSTVEIMNRVCREQFVALHSEPILEDLSKFLVKKYSYKETEFFRDGSTIDATKRRLNQLLTEVPAKGSFDLKSVLESTYFFS